MFLVILALVVILLPFLAIVLRQAIRCSYNALELHSTGLTVCGRGLVIGWDEIGALGHYHGKTNQRLAAQSILIFPRDESIGSRWRAAWKGGVPKLQWAQWSFEVRPYFEVSLLAGEGQQALLSIPKCGTNSSTDEVLKSIKEGLHRNGQTIHAAERQYAYKDGVEPSRFLDLDLVQETRPTAGLASSLVDSVSLWWRGEPQRGAV